MKWEQLMVALLLELRDGGETDFDRAWRRASVLARRRGKRAPDSRSEDESFASFFHRVCRREWLGLAHADYAGLRELLRDAAEGRGPRRAGDISRSAAYLA